MTVSSPQPCSPANASAIGVFLDGAAQRLNSVTTVALSLVVNLHLQQTLRLIQSQHSIHDVSSHSSSLSNRI